MVIVAAAAALAFLKATSHKFGFQWYKRPAMASAVRLPPKVLVLQIKNTWPQLAFNSDFLFQDKQLNHNTAEGVILTNRSLVLQGIDRTRSGGYTCQAVNAVGGGQSQVIALDVKCKAFYY